ncbi:NAD(P)H-dependent oxidoreductase [Brevibacillus sp. SYSU BS000544]|uniref:NAD(P)H-dependent oxidoreductase n=1 Tax=Brevibacillus sp. SYSU BS000544 TaxID=3416443 RepID=UPI003CE594B1
MKVAIVFAQTGKTSFNHEILNRAQTTCDRLGLTYTVRDLYQMNFQPVFSEEDMRNVEQNKASGDIDEEQQVITDADTLLMIYPVWWWSQPAILKGWIDRVFTDNFAFRYEKNGPVGLLKGKKAIVFTTTRESEKELKASGFDQVMQKQIVDGVLTLAGFEPVMYQNFAAVPYVTANDRRKMLNEVEQTIMSMLGNPVTV